MIAAAFADQDISSVLAAERVVSFSAEQDVRPAAARDRIVAQSAYE